MSRITKTLAEQVAVKLAAPIRQKIKEEETELHALITEKYEQSLPKEVLSFFKKHPKYVATDSYVRLVGVGLEPWNSYNLSKELPTTGDNSRTTLIVDEETSCKVQDFDNKIADLSKEYRKMVKEIEIALFGLRTYGKVQSEFPEAFVHLPEITTTALAVDLKSIRCKLDKGDC